MILVSRDTIDRMEKRYPGITAQIYFYEKNQSPRCPECLIRDTAVVNVGFVGRSINIAMATSKYHLRANRKVGNYYCNRCQVYFD